MQAAVQYPQYFSRRRSYGIQCKPAAGRAARVDGPADEKLRRQNRRHRHLRRQGQLHRRGAGRGRLWARECLRRADARRRPARYRLFERSGRGAEHPAHDHQHPRRRAGRAARDGARGADPQPPDDGEPAQPHPHGDALCRGADAPRRHRHQHLQPLGGLGRLLHALRRQCGRVLSARHVHDRGGHRPRPRAGPAGEVSRQGPVRRPDRPDRRG